jgi:outer membrane protein TolC
MKNAYLGWKSQLEVIKVNEDNVISSEEDFRLATERYAVGAGTELERRDAQVNLLRAKSSLVQAQYGAMTAYAGIEKVLGKLREPQ